MRGKNEAICLCVLLIELLSIQEATETDGRDVAPATMQPAAVAVEIRRSGQHYLKPSLADFIFEQTCCLAETFEILVHVGVGWIEEGERSLRFSFMGRGSVLVTVLPRLFRRKHHDAVLVQMEHLGECLTEPFLLNDDELVAMYVDAIDPLCEQCEAYDAVVLPQMAPVPAKERVGVVAVDRLGLGMHPWRGVVQGQPEVDVAQLS